eukprot:7590420-Lingulodinium_polyedra.AAC.1
MLFRAPSVAHHAVLRALVIPLKDGETPLGPPIGVAPDLAATGKGPHFWPVDVAHDVIVRLGGVE